MMGVNDMFCTNCGMKLDDEMLFCPNCGMKVAKEAAEEPPVAQEASEPEQKVAEESPAAQAEAEPEQKAAVESPAAQAEAEPEQKVAEESPVAQAGAEPEQKAAEEPLEGQAGEAGPAAQSTEERQTVQPASEPEQKAAEETPEPQAEKTKAVLPKPSVGVGILTFFLCLLIFLTGTFACVSGALRMSYAGDGFAKLIRTLDVGSNTIRNKSGQDVSIVDYVEEVSGFDFEKTAGFSKSKVEEFFGEDFVMDTVTELSAGYVNYFFTGDKPKALTRDDVVDFVTEHDDDFFRILQFRFTYQDPENGKKKVYTVDIDNAFKDLGTEKITVDWLSEQIGFNLGLVSGALSVAALIGLGIACVLLVCLVLVAQKKTVYSGFAADGITLMLAGAVLDIAAVAGLFWLGGRKSNVLYLFCSPLVKNVLILGSVVLAIGILFFVIGRGIRSSKAKKLQAAS